MLECGVQCVSHQCNCLLFKCAGNGLNTDELREALLMMMKSRDELAENNR